MSQPVRTELRPHRLKRQPAQERWILTAFYCPVCGKQTVWQVEDEGDDYYLGKSGTCECGWVQHNLPG